MVGEQIVLSRVQQGSRSPRRTPSLPTTTEHLTVAQVIAMSSRRNAWLADHDAALVATLVDTVSYEQFVETVYASVRTQV